MSDLGETLEVTFQIRRLIPKVGECADCGQDTTVHEQVGESQERVERFMLLELSHLKEEGFRAGIAEHLGKNIAACIRHYLSSHPVVKETVNDPSDKES